MGSCHHLSKFGFVALPNSPSAGPSAFITNQEYTIYRSAILPAPPLPRDPLPAPPGLKWIAPEHRNWPDGKTLKDWWSKHD